MSIVYYSPVSLRQAAGELQREDLTDFCEVFKIVASNACVIDRTGAWNTIWQPPSHDILYPLEQGEPSTYDFGEMCVRRALDIWEREHYESIFLMYSGGLDSTSMVLAFDKVVPETQRSRITILCTPESQRENPGLWGHLRGRYRMSNTHMALRNIQWRSCAYVQGEHADQLFGSDRVLLNPQLLSTPFNTDNLAAFVREKVSSERAAEKLVAWFTELCARSPLPIVMMSDFLWWLNFTCKWQTVALRTLSFFGMLDEPRSLAELSPFETFFNTKDFQNLSLSGRLRKWGAIPGPSNYKQAAREFIADQTNDIDWAFTKQKVGSLYNVVRHTGYDTPALVLNNNVIQGVSDHDLRLSLEQ